MSVKLEEVKDDVTAVKTAPKVSSVNQDALMGFFPINDLPSKYKLYPDGTLIHGRPLRVLEVKQLSMMTEDNSFSIINNVIRSCVRGINVDDILIADKMYILFWLRANTYKDPGYTVNFTCSKCKQPSQYYFNLDVLNIDYIKDENIEMLPIVLHNSGDTILLKYTTIADSIEVENVKSKTLSNPLLEFDEDILLLASRIVSINEKVMTLEQKYKYITNLTPADYAILETESANTEIGISTVINVKCDKCKETSPAGLSFRSEFFIPKYKNRGVVGN